MAAAVPSANDQNMNPIQFKHHTGASTVPALMPGSQGSSGSSAMPATAASTWLTVESYKNAASQANTV